MSKSNTITFRRLRETKNTIRFEEESDVPKIGALYIQKWALKDMFPEYPDRIEITIK